MGYPLHKHPDEVEEGMRGWFAFEMRGNEENEDLAAYGYC